MEGFLKKFQIFNQHLGIEKRLQYMEEVCAEPVAA